MTRRLQRGDRLVVASHNPGKVWEIKELIGPYGLDAVSAGNLGLPVPEETETTFQGNATIKARAAAEGAGLAALADNSGLEIDALGGAPGVYSADWAGPSRDFGLAMQRVHDALAERGAWQGAPPMANFISVLCLAWPDGSIRIFEGRVHGTIVWPPRGGNGFGYDPIFVADGAQLTFGEMEPAAKYAISHRTRAFEKFRAACLEEVGDVEPPPSECVGRDLEGLHAAARNLSTKAELVRFIGNLRADLARNGKSWENPDLPRYLEAMQAWISDNDIPDAPKWRIIAKALMAASSIRVIAVTAPDAATAPGNRAEDPGFGIYVHWPFCAQKCPYCDFNSHVRHAGWDEARFLAAYKRELDHARSLSGPLAVASIFFGGGTPSLMKAETAAAILDHIASLWTVTPGAEITLEANPGSVEAGQIQGIPCGRGQSRVGGRAVAPRRGTEKARPHSHGGRGEGGVGRCAENLRPLFARSYLRAARTDTGCLVRRA